MDPTATVAAEFPDTKFVHVSGFKKADNFSNLFGGMETAKYMVGMIAGAKAAESGSNRVGYIAPFPIAEVVRHINATARACAPSVRNVNWTSAGPSRGSIRHWSASRQNRSSMPARQSW